MARTQQNFAKPSVGNRMAAAPRAVFVVRVSKAGAMDNETGVLLPGWVTVPRCPDVGPGAVAP